MKKIYFLIIAIAFSLFAKGQCPTVTITVLSKTLTCNGPAATFTANFSPTINMQGIWLAPGGVIVNTTTTSPSILTANSPGTYTFIVTNNTTSCSVSQTVMAVRANSTIPTMTVGSVFGGYTINCLNPKVVMDINSSGTIAPIGYTWIPVSNPTASTTPVTGGYTATIPGQYEAIVHDGNFCYVSTTVTVFIDTLRPSPTSSTSLAGNSYTLNCYSPTLTATAFSNPSLSASSYSWVSPPSITFNSNTINIGLVNITSTTTPTTYTILAQGANGCIGRAPVLFYKNITAPTITVTPTQQTLTCNGACKSFTAIANTTVNTLGTWISPGNVISAGPSGTPLIICANAPGTYTANFTNVTSGCSAINTVAITSNSNIPTLTITPLSSNGFTINCANPSAIIVCNTSATCAPIGYTLIPLSNPTASVTPASGSYTATIPGQYEVKVHDCNFCDVSTIVTVFIDTLRPSPYSQTSLSGYTLNCLNSCLTATAITNPLLPSSNYTWTTPPSTSVFSNTLSVCLANITSSTTPYTCTVLAMNPNGCIGSAKVNFYKDNYIPTYMAMSSPTAITCSNPSVSLMPMAISPSTVPITFTFTSPVPTTTSNLSGATFTVPGTYTMTYQNVLNGCSTNAFVNVGLNITPPATFAVGPYVIPCGTTSTNITAGTNSLSASYTYTWTGPVGANMNNPNGYFTSADNPGTYTVFINNFSNGCSAFNYVSVVQTTTLNVPITGQDSICVGNGTNLSTNVSGATSYSWNTGSTSNVIFVTPTVTTVYSVVVTNTASGCSGSNTFTVNVSPCVGINELIWKGRVTLAPNPNSGKFAIEIDANIENVELKIINSVGQEVFKQNIKQGKNEINAGTLSKGIYHYNIYQNKQPVSRGKILIE